MEPEVQPHPPRVGEVTITVHVTRSGKPITGAQAKFELNMTHAGMTPVFVDAREVEPGRYRANTQLTMAGDWSLFVTVAMPDGTKAYQSFDIKGVSSA
ncbi:MAG TPA: FixH family protein [Pyrinomonadaceae bacterium]|nr:FixH family protein [Pyrinomonadaceae bacterium]